MEPLPAVNILLTAEKCDTKQGDIHFQNKRMVNVWNEICIFSSLELNLNNVVILKLINKSNQ